MKLLFIKERKAVLLERGESERNISRKAKNGTETPRKVDRDYSRYTGRKGAKKEAETRNADDREDDKDRDKH